MAEFRGHHLRITGLEKLSKTPKIMSYEAHPTHLSNVYMQAHMSDI
jgi:hypothetical protein